MSYLVKHELDKSHEKQQPLETQKATAKKYFGNNFTSDKEKDKLSKLLNKSGVKSPSKYLLQHDGGPSFRTSKQASKRLGLGLGINKVASDTEDNEI